MEKKDIKPTGIYTTKADMERTLKEDPRFEVGQKVVATWSGGHESRHTIEDIQIGPWGYWYVFEKVEGSFFGNGTYQKYLRIDNGYKIVGDK